MIKLSIKLDKRRRLNNGEYPLKYKIARKNSALYLPTGITLKESEWDGINEKIKNRPDKKAANIKIQKHLVLLNDKIEKLQAEGKLRLLNNKKLLAILTNSESKEDFTSHLFKTQMDDFLSLKDNKTTIDIYRITENKIKEFCDYEILRIEDIDIDWLDGFVEKLRKDNNSKNSIAIRLRGVRAVINFARKRGILKDYVFDMYHIDTEETMKRSLTIEQLRCLYNARLTPIRSKHRDIFFLIFFLMGINMIDLSKIKELQGERIIYRRAKTGTLYNIKVEPEAKAIIEKYKGRQHLLKVFDNIASYKYYEVALNDTLRKICHSLNLPPISAYWARHTFATIAYDIGIPTDIIADCLGHKSAHRITDIYIRKDIKKIDEANRRVIDYVLYKKR